METKIALINEKLSTIKELTKEIELFTHKQTELFEALNQKFPAIEQFSNALKDANELLMFVEHLVKNSDECACEVNSLQSAADEGAKEHIQKAAKYKLEVETLRKSIEDSLKEHAKHTAKYADEVASLRQSIESERKEHTSQLNKLKAENETLRKTIESEREKYLSFVSKNAEALSLSLDDVSAVLTAKIEQIKANIITPKNKKSAQK